MTACDGRTVVDGIAIVNGIISVLDGDKRVTTYKEWNSGRGKERKISREKIYP